MKRVGVLLPLILFIILVIFLWRGLQQNPHLLPSALLNKTAPAFALNSLTNPAQHFTDRDLQQHVSLVNVWASWCEACRQEHPFLMDIAMRGDVSVYAINYKDQRAQALRYLQQFGNPYQQIGFDQSGTMAINWGVYGTPETFVIDKLGVIRYKVVGPITAEIWQRELLPLINQLKQQG